MKSHTASKVSSAKVAAQYDQHVAKNYGQPPFALVRGKGTYVWDAENNRYLDFSTGIAVNTIGHGHPYWVEKVKEQAETLVHCSNLYSIPGQAVLAERLCGYAGSGRVFFCNSGTEANEFLIKLARLWGRQKAGGEEGRIYKVITAENSFHGRTFGGMGATPQAKIQGGFGPMLEGFGHAAFNDVEAFRAQVDDRTAAILIETIQGEGGIHPATIEFLKGIRALCDEKGILMLVDEVQCGIGRTGTFFAYEVAGITPDAIGMAKGLGGGFPMGAAWVRTGYDELFGPGMHGTTFGGSPLACAAANAVLDVIDDESLLEKVQKNSDQWLLRLGELVEKHSGQLAGVRGRGYHVALVVKGDPMDWVKRFRENGLLTVRGGTDAIRLLPPLNVTEAELDASVQIIDYVLATASEGK